MQGRRRKAADLNPRTPLRAGSLSQLGATCRARRRYAQAPRSRPSSASSASLCGAKYSRRRSWVSGAIGSARTSVYSNLLPIVAMLTAWLWLHEPIGTAKILGTTAVLAGVALTRQP